MAEPKRITSKELKRDWRAYCASGGFSGSYREYLRTMAARASDRASERGAGLTYPDAAWLLLNGDD